MILQKMLNNKWNLEEVVNKGEILQIYQGNATPVIIEILEENGNISVYNLTKDGKSVKINYEFTEYVNLCND